MNDENKSADKIDGEETVAEESLAKEKNPLMKWYVVHTHTGMENKAKNDDDRADVRERGILLGSGFVGGEGLLGIGIAAVAFIKGASPSGIGSGWAGSFAMPFSFLAFAALIWLFYSLIKTSK